MTFHVRYAFCFFKQKTAYEMRISDWSSDVCSSDLLAIVATKPIATQRDLALAYSPGVAAPCLRIAEDAQTAYEYTNKGNMVAVISNGTAVLGLGDLGAQASKPVMEGKCVLFKRFAEIGRAHV